MNIPSLKQKAEGCRLRLEEVENHIAALESDALAMLGAAPEKPLLTITAVNAGTIKPGQRIVLPKKRVVKKKRKANKRYVAPLPLPVGKPIATKKPLRVAPAEAKPATAKAAASRKSGFKKGQSSPKRVTPAASKSKAVQVPQSAPVMSAGRGGVDSDFDALT